MNWIITSAELAREIDRVKLVDVREPEEHAESRIEPSTFGNERSRASAPPLNIPLGEIQARAAELNRDDDIVLYCAHGVRSMYALRALQSLGFSRLRSLEGGICAWDEFKSGA